MDKETLEALKRILIGVDDNMEIEREDFQKVEEWITEIEKH